MVVNTDRTSAYCGTVNMDDPKDMAWVAALRKAIKAKNASQTFPAPAPRFMRNSIYPEYVKLQGRGRRYGMRGWCSSLPLGWAKTADVYIYNRYDR